MIMHSKIGRSLFAIVVTLCVGSGLAALMVGRTYMAAQVETPSASLAAVDAADAELRAGNVWDGAVTLLDELRGLPPAAQSIDDALAPMQFLSFVMCQLMSNEELSAFVGQLDPQNNSGDTLALLTFYRDWHWWEKDRGLSFDVDYVAWLDTLALDETPLVRMGAHLYKMLYVKEHSKREDREAAIETGMELVNRMVDEAPDARITRECLREVFHHGMRRAGDVNPVAIKDFLADPIWSDATKSLIAKDAVAQELMSVLDSDFVASAKTNTETVAGIVAGAMDISRSSLDPDVRAWFRVLLSSCLSTKESHSIYASAVRQQLADEVDFMLEAGSQADRLPLDVSRGQYELFLAALKQLEAAKWSTGESAVGPDLAHYDSLLTQKRDAEPIDMNLFERLPAEVTYFGFMLLNQDQYKTAGEVLRLVVEMYPNSELARHCQVTLNDIAPLL
jgi:hypothetical protein